ncbi:MAG TPA: alpha/beta hydrolase [Sedimentisphaerales bacterium]|nr:alpha/beta hydrolase [Sedimentisphaerales bacterium]
MKDRKLFLKAIAGLCIITLPGCVSIPKMENVRMENRNTFDHTTGRLVASGDAEIYVEEIGISDGPVLLMLHGGFGTIEDFNTITPILSRHFRLIGIDSRGHGRSSLGSTKLSYKTLTDDLRTVINVLDLRRFSILGFSDGGVVAYRYAAEKDNRLQKVVTVGASWEMNEKEPCWEMISGMTGEAWKGMFPASYDTYMRLNPKPDFNTFSRNVVTMWTDLSTDGHPGENMRDIVADMLVIRGDNDFLTNLESMARLKSMTEKVNFLNVPFAEHVAFDESPEIVLGAMGKFLGVELK